MPLDSRTAFSRGIIDCKRGKSLEDNPFNKEKEDKRQKDGFINNWSWWREGFLACRENVFGNMKIHGLYERF